MQAFKDLLKKNSLILIIGSSLFHSSDAATSVYPLTENTWSNPEFVDRFVGTYGFDLQINPRITSEEQELLQSIAPMMESNPRKAIDTINAFIKTKTDINEDYSAALDYTIGSLYLQLQDVTRAIEYYRITIKKFPNFFRAYQNMGLAYIQESQFKEAIPMLTKAIEIGGGNGTLWGLLGYAYLNTNRATQALTAYDQALVFQPDSKDWKLGKLNSLIDTGNTEVAIKLINEMLEESPNLVDLWLQQANAFLGSNQYLQAAANLELASRIQKAKPQSLILLGDLYLNEGLNELAISAYEQAMLTEEIGVRRLINLVEALSARNAPEQAITFLEKLQDTYSDNLTKDENLLALNLEAKLALMLGESERAATILTNITKIDPLNGKALIGLGDYYRSIGEEEKAILQFERALDIDDVKFDALTSLGRLYVSKRDYKQAVLYLERAYGLDPKPYIGDYIDQLQEAIKSM